MTFFFSETVPVDTGTVSVAFTDASLDLGDATEPAVRDAGLAELAERTGATARVMHQVHGADVVLVDAGDDEVPDADGLLTAQPGVALLARAADCVPVLLVGTDGLIGAVHAGREGVRRGVVTVALDRMRELGSTGVRAWVGPHICGACYEVPEELRAEIADVVPATHATTSWGTPALDLGAGVRSQLEAAGCVVVDIGRCTREDPDLHSYRRDGAAAGRLAGVVWRTP